MIVKTTKEINGVVYDYTYSDSDMMIERNGEMYSEAVDPLDSDRTYSETDQKLEEMEKRLSAIYSRAEKEIQQTAAST